MSQPTNNQSRSLVRWLAGGYLAIPASIAIFIEALLKESPLFWRNAGGFSVAFRDWVLHTFYPSFFLLAGFLLFLTLNGARHFRFIKAHPFISISPLLLAWIVLAATGAVVVADNLQNIFHGQPVHAR